MGLARHRKAIRAELADTGERYHTLLASAVSEILDRYELRQSLKSPDVLLLLIKSVARTLIMEQALGISRGHVQLLQVVERCLHQLEGPPMQSHGASAERGRK